MGEQIATILENEKARPTLVCEKHHGAAQLEGEVLGGKGVTMDLLHRRLGHTSQGGLERLVREQLVRGLEVGIHRCWSGAVAKGTWDLASDHPSKISTE